jgi:hypothetical protein
MSDDDLSTVSSSSDPLSDGSEYVDDPELLGVLPSRSQKSNEAVYVCDLRVEVLLKQGRWVCNANDLSRPVSNYKTFEEAVKENCFPFLVRERCVKVPRKGFEFSVEYYDI